MNQTVRMARSLSDENKVQANSVPEIRDAIGYAALSLRRPMAGIGPRLRDGNLINAFLLWCLLRPPEERERIARWGLRGLEFLKSRDEPLDLTAIAASDFEAMVGILDEDGVAEQLRGAKVRQVGERRRTKRTG